MEDDRQTRTRDTILQVVVEILESGGYDAVRVRDVAKRARVSMATIYRFFPTRDELIVAGMERWMDANCYSLFVADPPPAASLDQGLNWLHRHIFEPWERNPRMLEAYHRARTGTAGDRLDVQGIAAVEPVAQALFEQADPDYAQDMVVILTNMVCGVIERFAVGDLGIRDIRRVLERTVFRLTSDNAALTSARADGSTEVADVPDVKVRMRAGG